MTKRERVSQRHRCGFTLVELLVVVTIIALLASLLLPALNKARATAQTVACSSTLRGIGVGFIMYANNHDNKIPPPTRAEWQRGGSFSGKRSRWDASKYAKGQAPYLWSDALVDTDVAQFDQFDCPSVSKGRVGANWVDEKATRTLAEYAINRNLWDTRSGINDSRAETNDPTALGQITHPQEGLLVTDSNAPGWTPFNIEAFMGHTFEHSSGTLGTPPKRGLNRHGIDRKKVNVLFFDGHVKTWNAYQEVIWDGEIYWQHFNLPGRAQYYSPGGPQTNPTPLWHPWAPEYP